ncbi:related to triacylglycerol lipase II precursor [Rhynchosporium agropyri]|uniref:Carboxylic ester hydrolase n=1 Tax=Rhynchosporium agropyri TaxID=914238 RepID=A0A1E1L4A7_9HELO|nr:related to triacylglycerol lipase II precursor [Rhynchosporium agropyri]
MFSHLVSSQSIFIALAFASTVLGAPPAPPPPPKTGGPIAVTAHGKVNGFKDTNGNSVYLGIPYAASTAGQNRWRAPQPAPAFPILNASTFGQSCAQAISTTPFSQQGEDCLNLNIWAPAKGKNLPVFVYIYGGAMVTGSSSNTQLQGNNFAKNGVIMVSFNHRESIFASPNSGELTGTQNFGILDVEKAMDWVHANIAAFGGNPAHIVLGGHSSGGVHVDHYLWNHPDTWLAGAVEMSANSASGPGYAPTNIGLNTIAAEVGCPTGTGQLDCLRGKSIYELETASFNGSVNTWFTPVVDGTTRFSNADLEKRFKNGIFPSHVPLLTGNSAGEGNIFSLVYGSENTDFLSWVQSFDADVGHIPADKLVMAYLRQMFASVSLKSGTQYGDARFNCAVDWLLNIRSAAQKTWSYRWFGQYDNVVGVPGTAPTHGTEIPFFLGGNECFADLAGVTAAQQALADFTHAWFVKWIKNPAVGPGGPTWAPAKSVGGRAATIKLGVPGNELQLVQANTGDFNGVCRSVYNQFMPKYPVILNPLA